MFQLTRSVTWQALDRLRDKTANDRIRDYFTNDPQRFEKMSLRVGGLITPSTTSPMKCSPS